MFLLMSTSGMSGMARCSGMDSQKPFMAGYCMAAKAIAKTLLTQMANSRMLFLLRIASTESKNSYMEANHMIAASIRTIYEGVT